MWQQSYIQQDPEQEKGLSVTLHNIAHSFNTLGQCDEANAAAIEALVKNHGRVFEWCIYVPNFKSCSVCQGAIIPDSLSNALAPLPFLLASSSSGWLSTLGLIYHLPQLRTQTHWRGQGM